jgi:hypothetical protein
MLENIPGNSRKATYESKEAAAEIPEEKLEPIITGRVIRRKTPLGKRLMKMLFSGDTDSVGGYIVKGVLIPALQDLVTDVITKGIQQAVYGHVSPSQSRTYRSPGVGRPTVSYDRYAAPTRPTTALSPTRPSIRPIERRDAVNIGEIILERMDAENVMDQLLQSIESYGQVTVGSLLNLIKEPSVYTDHRWGWSDLSSATIKRVAGGYLLDLPPVEDLGK